MKKAEGKNGARGWLIALGVFVGLVLIAGIAYAWDVAANQDKIPRAVSVNGVDISAMDRTAAVEKLEDELAGVETEPVTVTSGDLHTELVPSESGLALDNQRAVDNIEEPSLNPFTRLYSFFRSTRDIPVETNVDETQLQPALERVKKDLSTDPVDGMLELNKGELKVTDPKLGQTVDAGSLHNAVTDNWLASEGVDVDPEEVEPAINDAAIEAMRTGDAAKALDNPITLKAKNNVTATLNKPEISQFTSIEKKDGKLKLAVDANRAQELLAERSEGADVPGVNAKISFNGNEKQVTPSENGEIIDWEPTMKDFDKRVTGDDREWDATYKPDPAEFTTEDAKKATFNDTVGEFTTEGYSAASGKNIELVAQQVNGAVVNPGETFSLNGYTGPRGTAQGYVESGIIIDGHSGSAVGGGISQFATTLYNAAYFAGMEDTAHTPHSYYISRYPAGREATVYEGAIDLQFTNTFNTPVRIETDFGGGKITVRLKGTKTVDVESVNNGRWANTDPQPMSVPGSDCSPSSGAPGFTTSDTRIIKDLGGKELSRETTTTVYDPQPIVRCG
ncbi:VanW family protein [Corynebacterium yonathiae]|uniref:VanW family protein n=1 Tax=Corynebacterium yonathiae TaxID=2913504 RepID=A0ABU8Y1V7_9CORY|nr:VanW family protein [uncultured Corynebacterium sp.]